MDWKKMTSVDQSEAERGVPNFLSENRSGTPEIADTANKLFNAAINEPNVHDKIPEDRLSRIYDEAMKKLMESGLKPNGKVDIPKDPVKTLSDLEKSIPFLNEQVIAVLDPTRALRVQSGIIDLKQALLPVVMWQLYESAAKEMVIGQYEKAKPKLKTVDNLLATAEKFGVPTVNGQTLGDFRGDALRLIQEVELKNSTLA